MGDMSTTERFEVKRVDFNGKCSTEEDIVINDAPLRIRINDRMNSVTMTPSCIDEFVVGHLLSEGFINGVDDILNKGGEIKDEILVDVEISEVKCLLKKIKSGCRLHKRDIRHFLNKLDEEETLFKTTGGTHIAALFNVSGNMLVRCEDVGRHNAVDKAIGFAYLNNVNVHNTALVISGRVAGDITLKVIRAKIPILISVSAPFYSSIKLSKRYGLTLIGFARKTGFNIYHDEGRII